MLLNSKQDVGDLYSHGNLYTLDWTQNVDEMLSDPLQDISHGDIKPPKDWIGSSQLFSVSWGNIVNSMGIAPKLVDRG